MGISKPPQKKSGDSEKNQGFEFIHAYIYMIY